MLRLRATGVSLTISSNAGIGPHKPHDVLPWGPKVMTSAGFSGTEPLRAVTSVAAQACRVGDRKGRIAPGYDSDLLAVAGDPLTDANAVREVVAVFRAGHRVRLGLLPHRHAQAQSVRGKAATMGVDYGQLKQTTKAIWRPTCG